MNTASKKIKISAYLQNLWKYRFLLVEIVRKNVKLQYRNSVLGIFWTFLQPLLTTLVLVLVFGGIFGKSNEGIVCYPIYLLCGRLLYEFFTQSTKRAMRSIRNSASVIKKVYVPKYIYPIANVLSNFVTFAISLSVLVVMMMYYMIFTDVAIRITPYILLSFVPIIILLVLCTGIGLILSTLNVFFKDIEYLYEVFCMLIFYATPIFYKVDALGANKFVQMGLMANPLYSIVSMFRSCVLFGEMWNWNHFFYASVFSLAMLGIGSLVFYKKQDKFILHI
ncbi:MAG: ABC transporter permease [Clostridia bacterium]|nr:ABC transporter permease [Clostridia bacterium]